MTDGNNKTMIALYLALILPCIHASGASGTTPGTVTLKRSVENSIASTLNLTDLSNGTGCTFDGASITLSHPMSLKPSDQFFSIGQLQLKSIELMVDAINTVRCGVHVNGTNHALELSTYGDDSSKEKVDAILQHMSYDDISNFWLGPYSSGLTGVMSPYATETNTVLIAGVGTLLISYRTFRCMEIRSYNKRYCFKGRRGNICICQPYKCIRYLPPDKYVSSSSY